MHGTNGIGMRLYWDLGSGDHSSLLDHLFPEYGWNEWHGCEEEKSYGGLSLNGPYLNALMLSILLTEIEPDAVIDNLGEWHEPCSFRFSA